MWKKILPLVFLAALIAWGVYDYVQNQNMQSESQQAEATSDEANQPATRQSKEQVSGDSEQPKASNKEVGIQKGNIAPDFTLKNLQGEKVKLSDFRGKNVIVNFWATWCPPCRVEMPHMQKYYESHKDNDFTILAVNLTASEKSTSDVKEFVKNFGLSFPVVLDTKDVAVGTYAVMAYPTSYFIDKQGVIQYKVRGAMSQEMLKKLVSQMK